MNNKGFTIIELLVTIGIIAVLATLGLVLFGSSQVESRDTKRIAEISQIGRFFSFSCYMPDGGAGEYDLADIYTELITKNPQIAKTVPRVPRDPASTNDSVSLYKYIVTADGSNCALYANLEDATTEVTNSDISLPTPGGGTGVFQAATDGFNGTDKYYQYSN
ncbi:MAG: type II secretion system protein [Patescibacteria group bacterium]